MDVLVSKKILSFLQLKQNNKDKINFSTWHPEGSKFTLKLWIFLQSILGHYCGFKLVSRTIQWETLDFLNDNFVRLPQTFQRVGEGVVIRVCVSSLTRKKFNCFGTFSIKTPASPKCKLFSLQTFSALQQHSGNFK